jgi:hypothetical protein
MPEYETPYKEVLADENAVEQPIEPPKSDPETRPASSGDDQSVADQDVKKTDTSADSPLAPVGVEFTLVTSGGGDVSKTLSLVDGKVQSKSGGEVWTGKMRRIQLTDWRQATYLANLAANQFLVAGTLTPEKHDEVDLVLAKDSRSKQPDRAARTKEFLQYRAVPTLMFIDHDEKHFTDDIKNRMMGLGGFVKALGTVCPMLMGAGGILRSSTSSGLSNALTGETYPSNGGFHLYTPILDGTDIPRFMDTLQDRCWLAGLADFWVKKSGALSEYSLIDTAVAGAERPIFEANPKVIAPLQQAPRPATFWDGNVLDTRKACPDLYPGELATLSKLKAAAKKKLKPQVDAARERFIVERTREAEERSEDPFEAREAAEKFVKEGALYPGMKVIFVDEDIDEVDVGELLADREHFDRKKCWDPEEGKGYGHSTAIFYADNMLIYSQAHGGQKFKIRERKPEGEVKSGGKKDNTRQSRAWRLIGQLKRDGCDYDETKARLLGSDDQGVVDWLKDYALTYST